MHVYLYPSIEVNTLSGRRNHVRLTDVNNLGQLKQRIVEEHGYDNEVGSIPEDFDLFVGKSQLNDLEKPLVDYNIAENSQVNLLRKRYTSFVEFLIQHSKYWWLLRAVCCIVGSLFIAALAQISFTIPHYNKDVPITLQTLAVLLIGKMSTSAILTTGTLYGWKLGVITVILYLLEGLTGAPFFASQTGGYRILEGPTSGYLFGFIVAAFVTGYLAEKGCDRSYILSARSAFLTMIAGNLCIYVVGVPVLAIFLGWVDAFRYGLLPFLVGDTIKIIIATALLPSCWSVLSFVAQKKRL